MRQATAVWATKCIVTLALVLDAPVANAEGVARIDPDETTLHGRPNAVTNRDVKRTKEKTQWYGAPIVVADLAALSLTLAAAGTAGSPTNLSGGLLVAGVGTYVLGGPIVHFREDRVATGFQSLALRLGAPLVGGAMGLGIGTAAVSGCTGEMCGLGALAFAAVGFGVGLITAPIVDSAVLARKPITRSYASVSLMPTYQPTTGASGVSVQGTW